MGVIKGAFRQATDPKFVLAVVAVVVVWYLAAGSNPRYTPQGVAGQLRGFAGA